MHVLKKETASRYVRPEAITSYLLASPRASSAEHLTTTVVTGEHCRLCLRSAEAQK
jgi:hypothetical protein